MGDLLSHVWENKIRDNPTCQLLSNKSQKKRKVEEKLERYEMVIELEMCVCVCVCLCDSVCVCGCGVWPRRKQAAKGTMYVALVQVCPNVPVQTIMETDGVRLGVWEVTVCRCVGVWVCGCVCVCLCVSA